MSDSTQPAPKSIREMSREEYRKHKREMLTDLSRSAAEQRDQRVLDAIKAAPDDAAHRRMLRQYSRRYGLSEKSLEV